MNDSKKFSHKSIEKKWTDRWYDTDVYTPKSFLSSEKPFYNLMMFPYPSAEGLHVGNMYAFTGADVYGRFKRMSGFEVFEPIGLDGFGIHSENYAIKIGRHPKEHAEISEKNFYRQLQSIGNGFSWRHRVETYKPEYYKFTQWLFVEMFKAGLAYKSSAYVNWCPSCKTVLADEQVESGLCERCKSSVERRKMGSWFFSITRYADRLLDNIDELKWPEKIKTAQRNWIGRSKGLKIDFEVEGVESKLSVWTKYWETIFGVTFIVLAPEHPLVSILLEGSDRKDEFNANLSVMLSKSEQERMANVADKNGFFTGYWAINPVNGEKVPLYIADYVLLSVGTGAVMGVPSHDMRDFEFAKKYDLALKQVISYTDTEIEEKVSSGVAACEMPGILVNSGKFDGLSSDDAKKSISEWLVNEGKASWETTYHLRDWGISRQRYWGPPIPMIYCEACEKNSLGERDDMPGWYTVSIDELPILLPDVDDFKPSGDGTSPLSNASDDFKFVSCPGCGEKAKRELDVSDTFLDSSWYFLAYAHMKDGKWVHNGANSPFSDEVLKSWFPVNAYIGGAEHAVLHLLYSRFVWMFLKDLGYIQTESDEPFPFLFSHGLIIKDGAKMSKSKGNVVVPDEYIEKYGADTLRLYLMFLGPYDAGGDFRDFGIEGMYRFVGRLWDLFGKSVSLTKDEEERVLVSMNKCVKKVTYGLSNFKYNTSISAIMEFVNDLRDVSVGKDVVENGSEVFNNALTNLCLLVAPFAPYLAEEVWCGVLGQEYSVHKASWPDFDEALLTEENISLPVQVNGKLRDSVVVSKDIVDDENKVVEVAVQSEKVKVYLKDGQYKKLIYVPGKILNIIV